MKKGIDPIIATVLLIAFTMAVAAILVSWITGFTKTQTTYVGEKGEKQVKCTYGDIDAGKSDVWYNFTSSPGLVNTTIFNRGDEDLYNFSFLVITDRSVYTFLPTNQKTESDPLKKRTAMLFTAQNTTDGKPSATETFQKLKIVAICQKDFRVWQEIDMT